MHAALGEWDEAHDILDQIVLGAPVEGMFYLWGLAELAGADLARGRWDEAQRHLDRSVRDAAEFGSTELFHLVPAWIVVTAEGLQNSPAGTAEKVAELREAVPVDDLSPRSSVWPALARYQYGAGNTAQGDRDWNAFEAAFAAEERGREFRTLQEEVRAARAASVGDWGAAAYALDRVNLQLRPCGDRCFQGAEWARVLEGAGRVDEAVERYRLFLADVPFSWHLYVAVYRGPVMERLGALLEEQGESAEAAAIYQMIVDEFQGGDGPFVAMVQRAQARLAVLGS